METFSSSIADHSIHSGFRKYSDILFIPCVLTNDAENVQINSKYTLAHIKAVQFCSLHND